MNKTKIDWATMSWNPVTGCRHGCPYCYARRTATRFNAGLEDPAPLAGGLHVLPEKIKATPYPYGFEPIAEMAWIFYTAIRNAGADVPEAAMLTREYLIATIHGKSNAAPEGE